MNKEVIVLPNKRAQALFFTITFLQGMVFYGPIATLYRQARGLNLAQITLIEAVSMLLMIALEIPWGFVCDRIGYKKTLIICNTLFLLSKVVFFKASNFAGFLTERLLLSFIFSGLSGCDSAYLYTASGKNAHRAFGIWKVMGTAGFLLSSLIFTLLPQGDYSLAALLTIAAYAPAAILTLFLPNLQNPIPSSAPKPRTHVLAVLKTALKGRNLWIFLFLFAAMDEVAHTLSVYLSQPLYLRAGLAQHLYGLCAVLISLPTLLAARSAHLSARLGRPRMAALSCLLCAVSCVIAAVFGNPVLAILSLMAVQATTCVLGPLADTVKNQHADGGNRAAILSVYSIGQTFVGSIVTMGLGRFADYSLPGALLLCAVLCMVCALLARFTPRAQEL